MVGTIGYVLAGIVTCDIVFTSLGIRYSVDIRLMCSGNGVWSDTTMDCGTCIK